jgi:SAM-dependent methyltransferase
LPERYVANEWAEEFHDRVANRLRPGVHILDVGAGRTPTVHIDARPADTRYVGLDLTESELALAPPGSYDQTVTADVTTFRGELEESFDLVVCFQVLEHVRPLAGAFDNMRRYLKPGGCLVAQLSGTFSIFGLANRVVPQWAIQKMVDKILAGHSYVTFPAYYDRCWQSGIERLLQPWSHVDVAPYYAGLGYFDSRAALRAAYIAWEEWSMTHGWDNLAPYYVVDAVR